MRKEEFLFDNHEDCLRKWDELIESGVPREQLTLYAPHPVHGLDDHVEPKRSRVSWFTLFGGLFGCLAGYFLCIYTSAVSWPIITGGKPHALSIPAYTIIAFELTILFGGLIAFLGFLILSRLPNFLNMIWPPDYGNQFAIVIHHEEEEECPDQEAAS